MQKYEFADKLKVTFAAHQANQIDVAEAGYRTLMAVDANHFDVLHLLGLICFQSKRYDEADQLIGKALTIEPTSGDANSNHGLVLLKLKKPEEALVRLASAVRLSPGSVAASSNYAIALLELGRADEALQWAEKTIKKFPDAADARQTAGTILSRLKRFDEAIKCFEQALERSPRNPESMQAIAACYVALDRPNEASRYVNDVLAVDPNNAAALLFQAARLEEAGDLRGALAAIDAALLRGAASAESLTVKGRLLGQLDRPDEALQACDAALAIDPLYIDALFCRGVALQALHDFDGAIVQYRKILAIDPDNPAAHWNEAYCDLFEGRLKVGFEGYEWRLKNSSLGIAQRYFDEPLWLGQFPLSGKRILLHAEQGYGDTFQYLRYVQMIKAMGAQVILEVQRAVLPLVKGMVEDDMLLGVGQSAPPFDTHCPLPSLPLAMKTDEHSIPAPVPYLFSDPERLEKWSLILGPKPGLRIGVVWSGNVSHVNDRNRSVDLSTFLAGFPNALQLVALQKELRPEDARVLANDDRVTFHGPQINDFADTAALIDLVDLVVCVDTGVAHLAAAMNKPTWILLDRVSDWRWQKERRDSPWYPSVELFRQERALDWTGVMGSVRQKLEARLPKPKSFFSLFSRKS